MKYLKTFESQTNCKLASDIVRLEMIEEFLEIVKEEPEYNIEEPEYDSLLDTWDGYKWQTYIQNDLKNNKIIYWEGWVKECWDAVYNKPNYKGLSKTDVISKIVKERFPLIAKDLNMKIIDFDYWYEESWTDGVDNGYIMKIIFGF